MENLVQIYTIVCCVLASIILALIIYRAYKGIIKKENRQYIWLIEGNWYVKILKMLFGVAMLVAIIVAPFYLQIASGFKAIISPGVNWLLLVSILLLSGLECYLALSVSNKLLNKTYKKVVLSSIVLVLLPLALQCIYYVPKMFTYPSQNECNSIDLPVKGEWLAAHAGGNELVNYHCAYKAQKYAMDIVKVDEKGRFFKGAGNELEDYFTMGENIYAPVAGTVVGLLDSLPNVEVTLTTSDTVNPAGNHIVIKFDTDRYLFLAHLNKGTLKVKKGDKVKQGDLLAQAGNSGNTSWPHLHMHIQDKPMVDNASAIGFPYRFSKINKKRWFSWASMINGFLIRNDIFKN